VGEEAATEGAGVAMSAEIKVGWAQLAYVFIELLKLKTLSSMTEIKVCWHTSVFI
jgi:hypothetical protein